jgi:hypothetical protein
MTVVTAAGASPASPLGHYVRARMGEKLPADTEQRPLPAGEELQIPPKKGWIVSLDANRVLARDPPERGDVVAFRVLVRIAGEVKVCSVRFVFSGYETYGGWVTK